jgi:hypothetical protein
MALELDLEGHGIGKLVAFFARRQAAVEVPHSHEKFKQLLESGAATAASNGHPSVERSPRSTSDAS